MKVKVGLFKSVVGVGDWLFTCTENKFTGELDLQAEKIATGDYRDCRLYKHAEKHDLVMYHRVLATFKMTNDLKKEYLALHKMLKKSKVLNEQYIDLLTDSYKPNGLVYDDLHNPLPKDTPHMVH
jgi:hypothetical protein